MSDELYFTKIVAEGNRYESEYDYKMYEYCCYCGEEYNYAETYHDEDCPTIQARKVLKEIA